MYEIEVKGLDKLIEKLGAATAQETLDPALSNAAEYLASWSRRERFVHGGGTGKARPDILTSRSGHLRSSITVGKISGQFAYSIGTNVVYARIHEFGGTIHRFARSSLLKPTRFVRGAKKGAFKSFSRGKGFTFGAYDINIPARPFLTPAIQNEDNRSIILNSVTKAINEALSK